MSRWLGFTLACMMAILILVAGLIVLDHQRFARTPLQVERPEMIQVAAGSSLQRVLEDWHRRGWLNRPRDRYWLRLRLRLVSDPSPIQAGEYQLRPGLSLLAAIAQLQRGEVHQYEFTLLEGWRFSQVRQALAGAPALVHKLDALSDAELMRQLGRTDISPEGRFLPETYGYPRGTSDIDVLRRAALAMDDLLQRLWPQRAPDLPLDSPEDALILASIVEKETGRADERALIAGVFIERLRRNMRLQTDPTVIYGLGAAFDGNLRRRDLRTDTPYNTYTRHGLPPGPIAMPGRAALEASLHPQVTGALYFVARGDGSHQFSTSLEEHQRAVRKYQLK